VGHNHRADGNDEGRLYHHFDSKESLASAIIEEGSSTISVAFRNVCGSSSPAVENMIHGTFTIAEVLASDKMARAAEQLAAALGGFNEAAGRFGAALVELMTEQARRAAAEGDLRPDVEPTAVSESIIGAVLGMRLLHNAVSDDSMAGARLHAKFAERIGQLWALLLAGLATEAALTYFREFLARESLRHARE
jgi:AcrR family transcriptional regulator